MKPIQFRARWALLFLFTFLFSAQLLQAKVFFAAQKAGTGSAAVQFSQIAKLEGVPVKLLYSIALTESGKKYKDGRFKPWPWTLNVQGTPLFFKTRESAWLALTTYLSLGVTLIDVGLMQVNWHYHKHRLKTPWAALEPNFNTRIGAEILKEQYRGDSDWLGAAGRYHRPVMGFHAARYQQKVLAHYRRL